MWNGLSNQANIETTKILPMLRINIIHMLNAVNVANGKLGVLGLRKQNTFIQFFKLSMTDAYSKRKNRELGDITYDNKE